MSCPEEVRSPSLRKGMSSAKTHVKFTQPRSPNYSLISVNRLIQPCLRSPFPNMSENCSPLRPWHRLKTCSLPARLPIYSSQTLHPLIHAFRKPIYRCPRHSPLLSSTTRKNNANFEIQNYINFNTNYQPYISNPIFRIQNLAFKDHP